MKKKSKPNNEVRKPTKKELLVESLKLPKDMMLGACMLSVTGNREVFIENYRGILEYTDTCILLQTKTGQVRLQGCGLTIAYYTNEDMKICGCITGIIFG